MLAPKLRFKEFNDEWKKIKLKKLLKFKNGINASKESYGHGVKYISVRDILNNNYITYDNIKGLVDIDENTLDENAVHYGDIVFQRSSETFEDIGQANVYLDENKIATFGGFVIRGKKISDYDPIFFNYLLKSPLSRKSIIVKGAGAQHYNISQEELEKISLYFPNLYEQQKIGKFLSVLDKKIELQQRKIEVLKMYKRGLINKIFNIQYNNTLRLKDLIKEKSIRNKENIVKEVYSVNNKCGFILQAEQFKDREVASEDTSNYKIVQYNDFAYNPARINVGSIARMKKYNKGIISPMYICFSCKEKLLPEYLEYYYNSEVFRHEMTKRLEGSVRMCLSYESMTNIPVDLPKVEEQKRITKVLVEIDNKIEKEEIIFSAIKKLKKGLLQKMFI